MQASQAAIRNHKREKLEFLKNAVLNSSLPNGPEEELQLIFINSIDTLSPWHIRVLDFLNNPLDFMKFMANYNHDQISTDELIEKRFEELGKKREFMFQIIRDLTARGFISSNKIYRGGPEGFTSPITKIGKDFLKYISSPS